MNIYIVNIVYSEIKIDINDIIIKALTNEIRTIYSKDFCDLLITHSHSFEKLEYR